MYEQNLHRCTSREVDIKSDLIKKNVSRNQVNAYEVRPVLRGLSGCTRNQRQAESSRDIGKDYVSGLQSTGLEWQKRLTIIMALWKPQSITKEAMGSLTLQMLFHPVQKVQDRI